MKKLVLISICLVSVFALKAQQTERDANVHFKAENYPVALNIYETLYKKDTLNKEIIYRLGVCYLNTNNDPKAALDYLLKVEPDKTSDAIFYFELGKAYLFNYKFDEAKDALGKAKQLSDKKPEFQELVDLHLSMTENARTLTKKPMDVSFVNMGKYINSPMNETTPMITADGEMLLFTSDNKYDRTFNVYTYDIYYSDLSSGEFKKSKPFTPVNTMDDEYLAGVSASGDNIYAQLQGYEAFEDLAVVDRTDGRIGRKTVLDANVNSKSAENSATESITGDTLFFSSARPEGQGGFDIYFSRKLPTGEWSVPTNLGNKINSIYDEEFPIMSPDGKTMYFCSNGTKSMGGYDIFKTILLPNGEFSDPVNIGFPLNDVFDNKTIAFSDNQRYAYVSAIRSDSYGGADIYRVVFNQEDPSVKIFILNIKKGTKEQSTEYSTSDTTLNITAYQKGKVIFGQYAYDSKNSQATIALPPGSYHIEIVGKNTESYTLKLNVEDKPGDDKIIKQDLFLNPKE